MTANADAKHEKRRHSEVRVATAERANTRKYGEVHAEC